MEKKQGLVVRWGSRGFGFLREVDEKHVIKEPLSEWFCHCNSVIGGKTELAIGTLVEFEPHPNPTNHNSTPQAFLVRVLANAGDVHETL